VSGDVTESLALASIEETLVVDGLGVPAGYESLGEMQLKLER
jgi:hypothetical protein